MQTRKRADLIQSHLLDKSETGLSTLTANVKMCPSDLH